MSVEAVTSHQIVYPEIRREHQTYLVSGDLVFDTVAALRKQGDSLFETEDSLCFDFREVGRSDSSAVSLLLAWLRKAKQVSKPVRFINLSQTMLDMTQAFDVKSLLPINA